MSSPAVTAQSQSQVLQLPVGNELIEEAGKLLAELAATNHGSDADIKARLSNALKALLGDVALSATDVEDRGEREAVRADEKFELPLKLIREAAKLIAELAATNHGSDADIKARFSNALKALRGDVALSASDVEHGENAVVRHPGIKFVFSLSRPQNAGALLHDLLGSGHAQALIRDLGRAVDCSKEAPSESIAILLLGSNSREKLRSIIHGDSTHTQEEIIQEAGFRGFADELQATIVCAALVRKAKDAGLILSQTADTWKSDQSEAVGKLSDQELDLLTKLRDGALRTLNCNLRIGGDGRLRANDSYDRAADNYWAFASAVSRDSKVVIRILTNEEMQMFQISSLGSDSSQTYRPFTDPQRVAERNRRMRSCFTNN